MDRADPQLAVKEACQGDDETHGRRHGQDEAHRQVRQERAQRDAAGGHPGRGRRQDCDVRGFGLSGLSAYAEINEWWGDDGGWYGG